jgi:hypothetical protein
MTSTTYSHDTRTPLLPAAVGTALVGIGFTALGVFGDGSGGAEHEPREFFVIAGISVLAVAAVFGLLVRRLEGSSRAAGTGLALSVVGLLSVAVFWAGLTPALAVGGMLLGAAARRSRQHAGLGGVAIAVGALALLGYVAVYVSDWMATNNIAGM